MKIVYQRRFNILARESLNVKNVKKYRLRRILKKSFMSQDDAEILGELDVDAV